MAFNFRVKADGKYKQSDQNNESDQLGKYYADLGDAASVINNQCCE